MAELLLTLLSVLAMLISCANCSRAVVNTDNIIEYFGKNEAIQKQVRDALLELDVSDSLMSVEDIRDKIEYAEGDATGFTHRVYESLIDLMNGKVDSHDRTNCPAHMVWCCVSILMQQELEPFRELVDQHKGRLIRCAGKELAENLPSRLDSKLGPNFRSGLGNVLMGALGGGLSGEAYLDELRKLDLTKDDVDAQRMLEAVIQGELKELPGAGPLHLASIFHIRRFFTQKCFSLMDSVRASLDIINLAALLGDERAINNLELQEVNEYSRICLAWNDGAKRNAILANIERQLVAKL